VTAYGTRSRTGQQNHQGSGSQEREDDSGLIPNTRGASQNVTRRRNNTQIIDKAQANLEPQSTTNHTEPNNPRKRQVDILPEELNPKRLAFTAPSGIIPV